MAEDEELTFAFLGSHPVEAARVLEALPAAEASALFAAVPARLGAPVLAAMLPPAAARLLGLLDDEAVLALFNAASTQLAVSLLRHIPERRRTRLIGALPTASAVASQLLLGFPDDAVGAWTDPAVVAVASTTSAETALTRVREGHETELEQLFVVDAERRLAGVVALRTLVCAPASMPVSMLMRPAQSPIAAMMPIGAAATLNAWERTASLAVVDHDKRLVGVLHRAALARAIRTQARPHAPSGNGSVPGALAASYWGIVSGLMSALLALLPPVSRALPEDE